MALTLYFHPLSSYCMKALMGLYENGTAFTPRQVNLGDPAEREVMAGLTPVGKIPALTDEARGKTLAETSVILEYLDRFYPGPVRLLPEDPDHALEVRTWDRVFDLYVQDPLQRIVNTKLRPPRPSDAEEVAEQEARLDRAYGWLDRHLSGRDWAAGDRFSLADCAAMPALFYGGTLRPFTDRPALSAYFERLIARPSAQRILTEAKPFFHYFPFHDRLPARFRD